MCVLPSIFLYMLSFIVQNSSRISVWRGGPQGAGCSSLHIEQGHTHGHLIRFRLLNQDENLDYLMRPDAPMKRTASEQDVSRL
jgi:hypothetical protein